MSDINPNTPVTTQAPQSTVSSGETATFDDLEGLFLNPEHRVKGAGKKTAKSEGGGEPEKKAQPKEEKKSVTPIEPKDVDAKAKDSEKKPAKQNREEKESAKLEADKAAAAKARRLFKGKHQDKDFEIDEDADFYVKVNGQELPVKAKDLFDNYSGKVAWDKKFNELNTERIGFKKERGRFEQQINQVRDMFQEKDPQVRLFKMAQIAGVSPVEFRKQFFDEMTKEVESYLSMDEHERKARDIEFENSYLKYEADAARRALADQQSLAELDLKVKGLLEKSQVPQDHFVSRYEELVSIPKEQKEILQREGKLGKNGQPTPEFIVETIQKDRLWSSVESALEGVKLEWNPQERAKKILNLVEDAYANGMKPSDIPEIVSEIWGKGRAKRVVERVEREREEHYSGKRDVNPAYRSSSVEPLTFDDL